MNVSLNWLLEYVTLRVEPAKLVDGLTLGGIEVEGVVSRGADFPHVVVAEILSSVQHPNADRLSVCKVNTGTETLQIVCGAKNYKVGDHIPLALAGAELPGGFKIKKGKLRGETSEGMMCSGQELGLSTGHDGLLILDPSTKLGTPIKELFPADTLFELEITPNRPDLLSHYGLARELVVLQLADWKAPQDSFSAPVAALEGLPEFKLSVADATACPVYTATVIEGVEVKESPAWLREKIENIGLRPINNLVDITNLVLHEIGQPMHVFDLDKLAENRVEIRNAQAGEKITALDHKEYALDPSDIVIADASNPVAVAGIIGGEASAVTSATRRVLLEVACFQPQRVRATSRRITLTTDSSYRFERGIDPAGIQKGRNRALQLILELAGGNITAATTQGSLSTAGRPLTVRPSRVKRLLGVDVPVKEICDALGRFGATDIAEKEDAVSCVAPSFRADLEREVDLIEDIARVIGLDRIPARSRSWPAAHSNTDRFSEELLNLKRRLTGQGFFEVITSPLCNDAANAVLLSNPMTSDQTGLRASLKQHLLKIARDNIHQGNRTVRLFEVGRVFTTEGETRHLAAVVSGPANPATWTAPERALDAFDLKGALDAAGLPSDAVEVLSPAELRELGLKQPVAFVELPLPDLVQAARTLATYKPWPVFPAIERDVALVVSRDLPASQVSQGFTAFKSPLLSDVTLFDLFTDDTGAKLSAESKSLAYSVRYRSAEKTLTDAEVNTEHTRLKEHLKTTLACEFRE